MPHVLDLASETIQPMDMGLQWHSAVAFGDFGCGFSVCATMGTNDSSGWVLAPTCLPLSWVGSFHTAGRAELNCLLLVTE